MEREIKFRAWHTEQKRMFKVWGIGPDFITEDTFDGANPGVNAFCDDDLNFLKVMQYTGLKDKNGKELYYNSDTTVLEGYSGHWIAVKDDFDIPVFKRTNDSFELIQFSDYFLTLTRKRTAFEIIGNIYETPELINP